MNKNIAFFGILITFAIVITTNLAIGATPEEPKPVVANYCYSVAAKKGAQADIMNPAVPEKTRQTLLRYWFEQCMEEEKEKGK